MFNLIRADFIRLFKSKCVYYGAIVCALLGIILNLSTAEEGSWGAMPEMGLTMFVPMCFSAIIGLTIISDFASGAIKNKVIMGNSRKNIYLSWVVSFSVLALFYLLSYVIVYLVSAKLLGFDMSETNFKKIITIMIVYVFLMLTVLTLSLMICFLMPDGKSIVIILLLQEPPLLISSLLSVMYPNSKVLDILFRILPQFQSEKLKLTVMHDKPWLTIICTLIVGVLFLFCGIKAFSKNDLK